MRTLGVGERQLVELAKILNLNARVVVLDEPTSVLTPSEIERLYGFIRTLASEGKAVVLITHKLADVAACADRIVVMRGGRIIDRALSGERSPQALVDAMVGPGLVGLLAAPPAPRTLAPMLQVRDLCAGPEGQTIRGISFDLPPGEIRE